MNNAHESASRVHVSTEVVAMLVEDVPTDARDTWHLQQWAQWYLLFAQAMAEGGTVDRYELAQLLRANKFVPEYTEQPGDTLQLTQAVEWLFNRLLTILESEFPIDLRITSTWARNVLLPMIVLQEGTATPYKSRSGRLGDIE